MAVRVPGGVVHRYGYVPVQALGGLGLPGRGLLLLHHPHHHWLRRLRTRSGKMSETFMRHSFSDSIAGKEPLTCTLRHLDRGSAHDFLNIKCIFHGCIISSP